MGRPLVRVALPVPFLPEADSLSWMGVRPQWRRQLVGTWGRAPPGFDRIFFARLHVETSCLVWLGI